MKKVLVILLVAFMTCVGSQAMAASYADIAFVIDQSGSMGDEFQWLSSSIGAIDTAITGDPDVTDVNYGVAGYEYYAGNDPLETYYTNAWQDITSDISLVVSQLDAITDADYSNGYLYGGTERGYQAVDWAADNFTWTGGDYAKVMVLITDEPNDYRDNYSYNGLFGEEALAAKMADENILLNVITYEDYYGNNYFQYWDDIAYANTDTGFLGLFDLAYLQSDPAGFTADFTEAKLAEIIIVDPTEPVPEPSTIILLGGGLIGSIGLIRLVDLITQAKMNKNKQNQ